MPMYFTINLSYTKVSIQDKNHRLKHIYASPVILYEARENMRINAATIWTTDEK
jgi:hypothetical protein